MTGPIVVPSGIAATTWDSGKDLGSVYSLHRVVMVLQPSSRQVEFETSSRLSHDIGSKLFHIAV